MVKMKSIGGDFAESYKFETIGDNLTGVLTGRKEVKDKAFKSGSAMFYTIKPEGKPEVSVIGTGLLDWMLAQVKDDTLVSITFTGTEKYEYKPGKTTESKRWKVEVPEDAKLVVTGKKK